MKLRDSKCKAIIKGQQLKIKELIDLGENIWEEKGLGGNFIGLKGSNDDSTIGMLLYCLQQSKKILLIPREMTTSRVVSNLPKGCLAGLLNIDGSNIEWIENHENTRLLEGELNEEYSEAGVAMFTTGSTGKPKVVYHSFNKLLIGAKNIIKAYKLTEQDRGIGVLPVTHMNGLVTTLIAPIISNSSVAFYDQSIFSYSEFVKFRMQHECTWFSATPYYLKKIVETINDEINCFGLRFIRSASSSLDEKTQRQVSEKLQCPVYNSMGMTEAAGQICTQKGEIESIGNVGFPINIEVKVKNNNGICSSGAGELVYRGDTIISKYLFQESGQHWLDGWLRSGDDGYIHEDYSISIRGRLKNTVNFCGIKFNAEEVEEYISDELNLQSAAIPTNSNKYGQRINVYIEENGERIDGSHVNDKLVQYFGYKELIKSIYSVKKLERFANQKLNRIQIVQDADSNAIYESTTLVNIKGTSSIEKAINLVCECSGYTADEIDKYTKAQDKLNWDSLTTLSIICSLEKLLERKIQHEEYPFCESIEGISALIGRKSESVQVCQTNNRYERELVRDLMHKYNLYQTHYLYFIGNKDSIERMGFQNAFEFVNALEDECKASDINLIMNSFTWQFCEGFTYSVENSRSEMGLINEVFRERCEQRTESAIYPYIIMSYDESLCHEDESCWGKNSTCQKLLRKESCSVINIGIGKKGNSLLRGNTCLHALEEINDVPYREFKEFTGLAKLRRNQREYKRHTERLFVRSTLYKNKNYEWGALLQRIKDYKSTRIDSEKEILKYHMSDLYKEGMKIFEENSIFPIDSNFQKKIIAESIDNC